LSLMTPIKNDDGETLLDVNEEAVVIGAGIQRTSASIIALTASASLTASAHAGRLVTLSAAAGLTVTLPAATGTGNVYELLVITTVTSNDYIIQVANATDSFYGGISTSTDVAGISELAVAGDDTITMNGSTTGGLIGSWFRVKDGGTGIWMLEGFNCSTGTEASAFSAAVS